MGIYRSNVTELTKDLENDLVTLNTYQANAILAEDTSSDYYHSILSDMKLIYEYLNPSAWNNIQLDSLFSTEGLEKSRDDLIRMAEAGKLDEATLSGYENLSAAIGGLDMISKSGRSNMELFMASIQSAADAQSKLAEEPPAFEPLNMDSFGQTISSIESGYSQLNDAMKQFEDNGSLSASTLTGLMDSGLIQYLEQTETGIRFNTDAYLENAEAVKANALQQLYNAMCHDLEAIAIGNTADVSSIAKGAIESAGNAAETAAAQASNATGDWFAYSTSLATVKGVLSDNVQGAAGNTGKQIDATIAAYRNIANMVNNMDVGKPAATRSSDSARQAQANWNNIFQKETEAQKAAFEAGLIDFDTYLARRRSLIEDYYSKGRISAGEYYSELKSLSESQLDIYKKALGAVTRRLDTEIHKTQDLIDTVQKENEALENQKDTYDKIISAVKEVYAARKEEVQASIDTLEKENDALNDQVSEYDSVISAVKKVYEARQEGLKAEQDAIQKRIDALQEENDSHKKSIELQKARYELERSRQQRTKMVFNGEQFVYTTDDKSVRENSERIAGLELEQTISSLEKEKEVLQELIDELDRYKNMWGEISGSHQERKDNENASSVLGEDYEQLILENRLEDIEAFRDRYLAAQMQIDDNTSMITSYEEKLLYYDSLSQKWDEISGLHESSINRQLAAEMFGAEWETLILEERFAGFDSFKNNYLGVQSQIDDNTSMIESYNQKIIYYQALKEQWNAISTAYEHSVEDQYAAILLGSNWENDVLNGRMDTLNSFRNHFVSIQQSMADAAWESANEQINAAKEAEKGAGGQNGVAGSIGDKERPAPVLGKHPTLAGPNDSDTALVNPGPAPAPVSSASKKNKRAIKGYSRGGVISNDSPEYQDWVDQLSGEDKIIAVSNNERVLTEEQNRLFEKLVGIAPSMVNINPLRDLPTFTFPSPQKEKSISLNIGEINMNNVQDVDGFARAIERELPLTMLQMLHTR